MRHKKSHTILPAADPAVNAGIRKQGERLRRRYLSNPLLISRVNVGNLKPRFSDINRGLPLLDHLQRYRPGKSSHERFSVLTLSPPRHVFRKDDRHCGPSAAAHLPVLTKTATAQTDRQSRHRLPANPPTGGEQPHNTEAPETAGRDTLLSAQGERLRARYRRTPLAHKSTPERFQRQSVICAKFIPRHLSALTGRARPKATQSATGRPRAPQSAAGEAESAPGIRTEMDEWVKGAARCRTSTPAKLQAKGKAGGVARSWDASRQSSHGPRQRNATSREDEKGTHPKTFSGHGSESDFQLPAAPGRVPVPGRLDAFSVRPRTVPRRLQTQRQNAGMDPDAPKSARPKPVFAKYPSTGIADQTGVSIKRQKSSISATEDPNGMLNAVPPGRPERFYSSTADAISTAGVIRLQQHRPAKESPTTPAQRPMSNSIRRSADRMVQHRRDDDSSLPAIYPVSPAQLKSRHAIDRRHSMNIPISNGDVPRAGLRSSGVDPAVPGMSSSRDIPAVKSRPHGIAAKPNPSAGVTVSAPKRLLLRGNESHFAGGLPLTLARSTRVDQSASMTRRTESPDPASIASEPATPVSNASEPDAAHAQEIKTDELVERVMRKVLRNFSIERERRGWFPWN